MYWHGQIGTTPACAGTTATAPKPAIVVMKPLRVSRPSRSTVVRQVTNGGGGMRPFRDILSSGQIDAIATYVSQVAGR